MNKSNDMICGWILAPEGLQSSASSASVVALSGVVCYSEIENAAREEFEFESRKANWPLGNYKPQFAENKQPEGFDWLGNPLFRELT